MDKIGFVILNFNTGKDTLACIKSIKRTFEYPYKIVVVDNSSTDNSYGMLSTFLLSGGNQDIVLIKTEYNGGFAYGNNRGLEELRKDSRIKYAVICNSDVIFLDNSIEVMIKNIKELDDSVIVAPLILDANRNVMTLPWKKEQSFVQYLGLKSARDLIFSYDELKSGNPTQVYMVSGCCYIVNIDLFKKMGAYDENTFLYHEEGTVGKAALKNGYKTYIDINAKVIHNQGASTGKSSLFTDTELIMSGLYYWKVYEGAGNLKLFALWATFNLKIVLKTILHKYNTPKGITKSVQKTYKRMIAVINGQYGEY